MMNDSLSDTCVDGRCQVFAQSRDEGNRRQESAAAQKSTLPLHLLAVPTDCAGLVYRIQQNPLSVEAIEVNEHGESLLARRFITENFGIKALACSADGRLLATATTIHDGTITCYDVTPSDGIQPRWTRTVNDENSNAEVYLGFVGHYLVLANVCRQKVAILDATVRSDPTDVLGDEFDGIGFISVAVTGQRQVSRLAFGDQCGCIKIYSFSAETGCVKLERRVECPSRVRWSGDKMRMDMMWMRDDNALVVRYSRQGAPSLSSWYLLTLSENGGETKMQRFYMHTSLNTENIALSDYGRRTDWSLFVGSTSSNQIGRVSPFGGRKVERYSIDTVPVAIDVVRVPQHPQRHSQSHQLVTLSRDGDLSTFPLSSRKGSDDAFVHMEWSQLPPFPVDYRAQEEEEDVVDSSTKIPSLPVPGVGEGSALKSLWSPQSERLDQLLDLDDMTEPTESNSDCCYEEILEFADSKDSPTVHAMPHTNAWDAVPVGVSKAGEGSRYEEDEEFEGVAENEGATPPLLIEKLIRISDSDGTKSSSSFMEMSKGAKSPVSVADVGESIDSLPEGYSAPLLIGESVLVGTPRADSTVSSNSCKASPYGTKPTFQPLGKAITTPKSSTEQTTSTPAASEGVLPLKSSPTPATPPPHLQGIRILSSLKPSEAVDTEEESGGRGQDRDDKSSRQRKRDLPYQEGGPVEEMPPCFPVLSAIMKFFGLFSPKPILEELHDSNEVLMTVSDVVKSNPPVGNEEIAVGSTISWIAIPKDCMGLAFRVREAHIIETLEMSSHRMKIIDHFVLDSFVAQVACSDGGEYVAAVCLDGSLRCFEITTTGMKPHWSKFGIHSLSCNRYPSFTRENTVSISFFANFVSLVDTASGTLNVFDASAESPFNLAGFEFQGLEVTHATWASVDHEDSSDGLFCIGDRDGVVHFYSFDPEHERFNPVGREKPPIRPEEGFVCTHLSWYSEASCVVAGYFRTTTEELDGLQYTRQESKLLVGEVLSSPCPDLGRNQKELNTSPVHDGALLLTMKASLQALENDRFRHLEKNHFLRSTFEFMVKPSCYFEVYNEYGTMLTRSEVVNNTCSPQWAPFALEMDSVCAKRSSQGTLLFEFYTQTQRGGPKFLGEIAASVNTLLESSMIFNDDSCLDKSAFGLNVHGKHFGNVFVTDGRVVPTPEVHRMEVRVAAQQEREPCKYCVTKWQDLGELLDCQDVTKDAVAVYSSSFAHTRSDSGAIVVSNSASSEICVISRGNCDKWRASPVQPIAAYGGPDTLRTIDAKVVWVPDDAESASQTLLVASSDFQLRRMALSKKGDQNYFRVYS